MSYQSLLYIIPSERLYVRYRFSHKFKRHYSDGKWTTLDALTPKEVEALRKDELLFDAVPPEAA